MSAARTAVATACLVAALGACSEPEPPALPPGLVGDWIDPSLADEAGVGAAPAEAVALGDVAGAPLAKAPPAPRAEAPYTGELATATPVTFEELQGFDFEPPTWEEVEDPVEAERIGMAQIPEAVKALDGEVVVLEGYMHPIEYENAYVRRFIVVADPAGCCFGVPPPLHGYVEVLVEGKEGVPYHFMTVVEVRGTFGVRTARHPRGYPQGIYTLAIAPKGLRVAKAR